MRTLLTLFLTTILFSVDAQLTTTSGSPSSLVQNVLIGPGVTVSNINYSGSGGAIGQFNGSSSNIGLASGIVMTTGTIANNGGPQGPNDTDSSGTNNGYGGYSLLTALLPANVGTFNAAVLEFDFVPLSDTVQFRYVFGSEEYPEYVHSDFNDLFGFFISGPGISGIKNIALLPNSQPVAINNIHGTVSNPFTVDEPPDPRPAAFGSLYVDNSGGTTVQYDGFTKPLTAISKVQCGQKYHIIIAIADAGDPIYDSGIFLEANSFTSPTNIDIKYDLSHVYYDQDYIMAEGCTDATITLTRHGSDLSQPLTVTLNATGTATEGTDYSNVPTSVTFPANQAQTSFTFSAFNDALTEGQETVDINFDVPDPCGNSNQTTIHLIIQDVPTLAVTMADVNVQCEGDDATLTPIATGGAGDYTYSWSTGETTATITDNPLVTTNYSVTVHEGCQNQSVTVDADIIVPVFGPIILNTSPDTANPCPFIPYTFFVEANGGAGDYSYQWSDDEGTLLGRATTQFVKPGRSTTYYILVTDRCGKTAEDSVKVTVTSPPLVVDMFGDTTICFGDSALFTATATGGWGAHFFYWPSTGDTTSFTWLTPRHSEEVIVQVQDDCHTFTVPAVGNVKVIRPIANFEIESHTLYENLPITFHNTTYGGSTYQWEFGDGQRSTLVNPNNTYDVPGTYYITLHAQNEIGCRDSVTKPITILPEFYIYIPNAITPNGDGINDVFAASTINVVDFEIYIFNRWGQQMFHSTDKRFQWDATYQGEVVEDGVYVYKVHYTSINGDDEKVVGHVVSLR